MINLKNVSKDIFKNSLKNRGIHTDFIDGLYELYKNFKEKKRELDLLLKEKKNENISHEEAKIKKVEIQEKKNNLTNIENDLKKQLETIPNILHDSVPFGIAEENNVLVKQVGDLIFKKNHYEFDLFEDCAEHTGSRFVILKGKFAVLYRGLISFCLDFLRDAGFTEFIIPTILKSQALKRSGHLPNLKEDMFKVEQDQFLIPTSECVLVNLCYGKSYKPEDFPLKYCAFSPCYRGESGAAGKDQKGLIRLHQFYKCEMMVFTEPEKSYEMLEEMVKISSSMLQALELPYQVELLCSGDTGFCSSKTYDLKVPIGNKWREVASISNTESFQTSNMKSKIKIDKENKVFPHALNGSALPIERTLASILEVHYQENKIMIPKVLRKYTSFDYIEV